MLQPIQADEWKKYRIAGLIAFIIFILVQIVPQAADPSLSTASSKLITEGEAEMAASAFIQENLHEEAEKLETIHQSESMVYGYLTKEKLLSDYSEQYDKQFPTDVYQVESKLKDGGIGYIYVHMETGTVVAWHLLEPKGEGNPLTGSAALKAAKELAVQQGFRAEELKRSEVQNNGTIMLYPAGYRIGEAALEIKVRTASSATGGDPLVTEYKPAFVAPSDYVSYVEEQKSIANLLSVWGYLVMTGVLFLFAVIYAILYRKHTSFQRGLLLTGFFLAFYIANNFNMADGLRSTLGESTNPDLYMAIMMFVTVLTTVVFGAAVYFSLVAGDGLWRAAGQRLWPRFGEPGYGDHVWQSMKLSYLFAIILLGMQSIILIVLQLVTGAWSTSDATQSPYNMALPWLMPLLAWCAAISEESIYRLFGIGLLRKWLRNPWIAALIPSVIWALGHVAYPIFPSTTRLIELVILGLVFSWLFLRYGFITAVFTHAILDSILMAASLLFMGTAANVAAAIFYLVLPVPIAWVMKNWRSKKGTTQTA
ncbi:CPBP family intramembrane glutamic endopeptidase [Paenibacillus sp. GCM10023252]|uniref:CPBP family intramembrane glutamic endopeptidase n=1 Tax=Paenibacillus sp. GCM10023252 TaxID=3252649 RepID=UPI003608226D